MKNREVARIFNEVAELLELKGENPFRIRAYRRAAQNIEGFPKDVAEVPEEELIKMPGIGKDLAGKIQEVVRTGTLKAYEELRKEVPEGLSAVMAVPGLGPKKAKLFYDKLHVKDIDDLERLAKAHRLKSLPGIQKKTEENILKGIEMLKRGRERKPLGFALPLAEDVIRQLEKDAPVKKLALAGSIRRFKETVKDIDILCTSTQAEKVMKMFTKLPNVKDIVAHGPTKSSVILEEDIQVDLRVVEEKSFGAALAYFTGSKAHNIRLREMAVKAGLKINEYGVFREKDDKRIGGEKEEDIYDILGLQFVPPELREDSGEIEAALEGKLPELVTLDDIRGDLHVHTKRSDGSHTLEDLVKEARRRDYKYLGITDHSKGLGVAGGQNEDEVLDEMKEIDSLNRRLRGFRVLKGVEVDIRSDYSLDLPDDILKKLDFVVASIHSGFNQPSKKLTRRLTAAMKNSYVTIVAHPTGRLLGKRDAYDVDMDEVLKTASKTGTALEINSYPLRLDLSDVHARAAGEKGIPISISTDTHILSHFEYMSYGVSIARRAWLGKKNILNALGLKALLRALGAKRGK